MSNRRAMIFTLGGWDADALAFLSAAGITDLTIRGAINTYVKGLKSANLWARLVALYPFVGGTAGTHKFNLKDPRDLDAAFRLTFSGGVTHDANGVTFDGINGFANSHIIPSTNLTLNDESMILYSRTSAQGASGAIDAGAAVTTSQRDELSVRNSTGNSVASINATTGNLATINSDGKGLIMGSRISSTDLRIFKNGSQLGSTQTSANTGTRSNIKIFIGARNVSNAGNGFVNRNFALAGFGLGFNTTQALNFYNLTQTFQTALGRAV